MDVHQIKTMLNDRVHSICEMLLPDGQLSKDRKEWVQDPGTGKVKVVLSGHKVGRWAHFGGDDSGDLIDLWQYARNMSLGDAMKDIKDYLGIEEPRFEGRKKKQYERPEKPQCTVPGNDVKWYLTEERDVTGEAIAAYKIGENGEWMVFPYLRGGDLIFVKHLSTKRDENGKKKTWVSPGAEPCLFGWQAIPDNARTVCITEGEIDAMTMWDYGYPSLSVPFGGGRGAKQRWIETEFENLDRFETIYLCLDSDDEGQIAVSEIADRLGLHRCRIVTLPHKDANECKQQGVEKAAIDAAIRSAGTHDPEELRNASEYSSDVYSLFYPDGGVEPGYELPWNGTKGKVLFRPGEITIWQGESNMGKSQVLGHASIAMMGQGARMCIASLEMAPARLLKRMAKQATGLDRPSTEYLKSVDDWYLDRCWMFNVVGKSTVDRVLEVFEYARRRYGVDSFIIDSFMRMGIGAEDWTAQGDAMFEITNFAVQKNVHVHLVCHSRKKGEKSSSIPEDGDIKGASEILNNAFNVVGVWWNKKRDLEIEQTEDQQTKTELEAMPGVVLNVSKQRNGDWTGRIGLWFHQESYQYLDRQPSVHNQPNSYVKMERSAA